jgi:hypothetical protein
MRRADERQWSLPRSREGGIGSHVFGFTDPAGRDDASRCGGEIEQ